MTDVPALIAAANANLPTGWSLDVTVLRPHKYRNKWRVEATYHGLARAHWDVYSVGRALLPIVEWIEAHPVEEAA